MKPKKGEIEPENCQKVPKGKLLNAKFEARLVNGKIVDSIEDVKVVYTQGDMIHGLLRLLEVSLTFTMDNVVDKCKLRTCA